MVVFDHGQPPREVRHGVTLQSWPRRFCLLRVDNPWAGASTQQALGGGPGPGTIAGRLDPMKDYDTFLEAARRVALHENTAQFGLAGRGVGKENGKLAAALVDPPLAGRTHLLGERHDMPRLTAAFDFACSSSRSESFPNAVVEAMACGVVCVATDAGDSAAIRTLVSVWRNADALVIGGREPKTVVDDSSLRQKFSDFTERMMAWDLVTYLPDDILVKVDRASMGASLEVRNPLLDHRIAEWAWKMPANFKRRAGQSKWLLRQVLYRYVAPRLVERPKMGFGIPIGNWLRSSLREWAEDLLGEKRLREGGLLRAAPVRELWADHLGGKRKADRALRVVLMFQAWLGDQGIPSDPKGSPSIGASP